MYGICDFTGVGRFVRDVDLSARLHRLLQSWDRQGLALLSGSGNIYQLGLVWQVQLRLMGLRVHNVDCAMRFDVFPISEEARRWLVAPEEILDSITIQRAFTPYQILDVMHRILRHRCRVPTLYCFLAPCKQFFDGDVSEDEAFYLLSLMPELLAAISRRSGPLLIIEQNSYEHPAFQGVYRALHRLAAQVWILDQSNFAEQTLPASRQFQLEEHYGQNTASLFHADGDGPHAFAELPQRAPAGRSANF